MTSNLSKRSMLKEGRYPIAHAHVGTRPNGFALCLDLPSASADGFRRYRLGRIAAALCERRFHGE
jgi:hypothetical protein